MSLLPEIIVDTKGEFGIEGLEDWAAAFPELTRRSVNSALSSEGNRLRNILKRSIQQGGPAGASWPKRSAYAFRLMKEQRLRYWGHKRRATKEKWKSKGFSDDYEQAGTPLAKFAGGIRYKVDSEMGTVDIGFVNPSARFADLLGKSEQGFSTPVTRRMQKFFFSLGLPIKKSTTSLTSPKRPLIGPVFEAEKGTIATELERKFFASLERYMNKGKKS